MPDYVGIDLGTTFSAVAHIDSNGQAVVLANGLGERITPSVIYFGGETPLVGAEAKEMQALGEQDVAFLFKRNMGDPNFVLNFHGRDYTATDLSAILLAKLKADAEIAAGLPIKRAVITVPAYFDNHQRQATITAGEAAGLEVLRIINEPTAAALAYGYKDVAEAHTLVVYDLGGGTFDVTVVRVDRGGIQVLGTDGDHQLGGRDWDDRIANYLASRFEEEHGVNPLKDSESGNDLLVRCENAKKQLSTRERARISIAHQGERESYELDRTRFEELTRDLMERTQRLTEQALADIDLDWSALDGVLLVGGSTRMPMVGEYVTRMSGKPPLTGVNVDEVVALGAALQASLDAEPKCFTLGGAKRIVDVMSHSLGMVAVNEDRTRYVNSIIIPKNKAIPCAETRPFQLHTAPGRDNLAEVYMLQGESGDPTRATVLGKYTFSGISHVRGKPAVLDITYAYDHNGVVTVSAKDRADTGALALSVEPIPEDMSWLALPPEDKVEHIQPHLSVLMAIDLSGSMRGDPLVQAQKAAKRFLGELDLSHTSLGLIGFADSVEVTQDLTQNGRCLERGIDAWTRWMQSGTVGYGNAGEPFTKVRQLLQSREDPRFLIVLTDGCWYGQKRAIARAREAHDQGIEIIALGFGGADYDFLKAIATSDENALFTDLSQLSASFSKIAQVLTNSGGGFYVETDTTGKQQKKCGLLSFFG